MAKTDEWPILWDQDPDPLGDLWELQSRMAGNIGISFTLQEVFEDAYLTHKMHQIFQVEGPCPCKICQQEAGQSLVEYALILLLVAIIVVTIVTLVGVQLQEMYDMITSRIEQLL